MKTIKQNGIQVDDIQKNIRNRPFSLYPYLFFEIYSDTGYGKIKFRRQERLYDMI